MSPIFHGHGETRSVVAIQLDHHTRRSRVRDDYKVGSLQKRSDEAIQLAQRRTCFRGSQ